MDFNVGGGTTAISRTINHSSFSNDSYIQHYYGHVADQALNFDITIGHCERDRFTQDEVVALSGLFLDNSAPKTIRFIPEDADADPVYAMYYNVEYIGSFTSMSYTDVGLTHKVGLTFHFENISAYAFSPEWSATATHYSNNEEDTLLQMNNPYGVGEIIYPQIEITPIEGGVLGIDCGQGDPFEVHMRYGSPFIIKDRSMYYKSNGNPYSFDNLENFNWPYLKDFYNGWVISGNSAVVKVTSRWLVPLGY